MADDRESNNWLYRSMLTVFILFISICLWAHHPQYEWGMDDAEGYGGLIDCCCFWPLPELVENKSSDEPDSMFYIRSKDYPSPPEPVPVPYYTPEIRECSWDTHRHTPWKHRIAHDTNYLPLGLTGLNRKVRLPKPELNGEEADIVLYLKADGQIHARELLYASSEVARDSLYAVVSALSFEKFDSDSIKPVRLRLLWREGYPLFY